MLQTVALELMTEFNCYPVFLTPELKERFYKGATPFLAASAP